MLFDTNIKNGTIPIDSNKAAQPEKIKVQLKEHQLKMLYYIENFEKRKQIDIPDNKYIFCNRGFICDKVGSGKSLEILSSISNTPELRIMKEKDRCIFYDDGIEIFEKQEPDVKCINLSYMSVKKVKFDFISTNVIVVPHGITSQWIEYIQTFTELSFFVIKTTKDEEAFRKINPSDYQIILISSTRYKNVFNVFEKKIISRLIFDEADTINIPNCVEIQATFTWFITSSIRNIIACYTRNTGFLRDIVYHNSRHEALKYLLLKNPDTVVEQSLQLPEPEVMNIICKRDIHLTVLDGFLNQEVYNMINAGAITDAIASLQIEQTSENSLISVVCKNLLTELHNKKIEYDMKQQMTYSSKKAKEQALEGIQKKIEETENKIHLIKQRISETNMDPITYEEIVNPVITMCCNNKFDFESIAFVLKKDKICPICRKQLAINQLIYITEKEVEKPPSLEYNTEEHNKFYNLEYVLNKKIMDSKKKILIFSEFDNTFNQIIEILNVLNLQFRFLQGSHTTIKSIVDEYKSLETLPILLLNARHFGAGLNLENTTDVIIFHKMNSDLEKQVIGRAQRLGRKTRLTVWKLLYKNEV